MDVTTDPIAGGARTPAPAARALALVRALFLVMAFAAGGTGAAAIMSGGVYYLGADLGYWGTPPPHRRVEPDVDDRRWTELVQRGTAAHDADDLALAEQAFDASVKEARTFGQETLRLATSYENLGVVLHEEGRADQAVKAHGEALRIRKDRLGPRHELIATSLNQLGRAQALRGDHDDAVANVLRALAMQRRLELPDDEIVPTLRNLGDVHAAAGSLPDALDMYRRVLDLEEERYGANDLHLVETLDDIGGLLSEADRIPEAIPFLQRSLDIRRNTLGETHASVAHGLEALAGALARRDRFAEAQPLYLRALECRTRTAGSGSAEAADVLSALGVCLYRMGAVADAEDAFRRELSIRDALAPEGAAAALALSNLAQIAAEGGRHVEAETDYRRAIRIRYKVLGKSDAATLASMQAYAKLLRAMGRSKDAEMLEEQVTRLSTAADAPSRRTS